MQFLIHYNFTNNIINFVRVGLPKWLVRLTQPFNDEHFDNLAFEKRPNHTYNSV